MRTWIFFHANCLDGFGAAFAAWKKFGYGGATYRACSYDEGEDPFDMCETGDEVFVLDFSFKRDVLLRQKERLKVTVIDHHKTAEEDLRDLDFCIFDMTQSGAVLAWKHFHPDTKVPKLLRHIQDRDLWKFEMFETKEITTALRSLSWAFDVWEKHMHDTSGLSELGTVQCAVVGEEVRSIAQRSGWLSVKGHRVPAANSPIHQSEIGHALLTEFPEAPFAVVYFDFEKADGDSRQWVRTYSLRAESGFDVGEIAKAFGGGGHRNAAGFTVKLGRVGQFSFEGWPYGHSDIVPAYS
jgi:oligoribonuclease NrnB/cAMP/cGMP phosphodiesterase (DHH superfamily)